MTRYLGGYEVGPELGRGASGSVHRARDRTTGREVALKVIVRELAASPGFYERFLREASVAARVVHSNVAVLFTAGEQEGTLFLALELVPGGSLAQQLRSRGRLPWEEAVARAAEVARGLQAVHAAGLVHRDVTPGNVLLDQEGHAKLADFGLVRRIGARSAAEVGRLTQTGEVLGTLEYLSPEQANGTGEVGPAADLYGLGATLHALVAGAPPFRGDGLALVRQHLVAPPPRLATLVPDVPPALEELVLRLLDKDPARRGTSAGAVALELEELLADAEPAAPEGARLKLLTLVFAVGMGALGLGVGWLAARGGPPPPRPSPSPTPTPRTSPSLRPSPSPSPALRVTLAPADGRELARRLEDPELKAIADRCASSQRLELQGVWGSPSWKGREVITAGALAPSGKWLVTGGADWFPTRRDLQGHVIEPLASRTAGWVRALAVSPDEKWIAAAGDPRQRRECLALYEVGTEAAPGDVRQLSVPAEPGLGAALSLAFWGEDGRRIVSGHADGTVRIWDRESREPPDCLAPPPSEGLVPGPCLTVAVSPDGRLVAGWDDGWVRVGDLANRTLLGNVRLRASAGRVAWTKSGDRAVVGLADGSVAVLVPGKGARYVSSGLPGGAVCALAVAPAGDRALVSLQDGTTRLVPLEGEPRLEHLWPPLAGFGVNWFAAFLPDGGSFVVGGESHSLGLFDLNGPDLRAPGRGHEGGIEAIVLSPGGKQAVTSGSDGTARTWDVASGRETSWFPAGEGAALLSVQLFPDGRRVLAGAGDGEARAVDLERFLPSSGERPPPPPPPPGSRRLTIPGRTGVRLALEPDGRHALAVREDGTLETWDAEAPRDPRLLWKTPAAAASALWGVGVSPEGDRALVVGQSGEIVLVDLRREAAPRLIQAPVENPADLHKLAAAAFVPGTNAALVGAWDATVRLWDLGDSPRAVASFAPEGPARSLKVNAIAVAPDGRTFFAATDDGTLRLWDLASATPLDAIDFAPWSDAPRRLVLADQGRTLLVGTARGVVYRFVVKG